jgi:hypothetical protein
MELSWMKRRISAANLSSAREPGGINLQDFSKLQQSGATFTQHF